MANKSPAFQFYPRDFLSDSNVMIMPNEVVGMYIKLLCIDWLEDGLIEAAIPRLVSWNPLDEHGLLREPDELNGAIGLLKNCFVPHPIKPGKITNPRLQKIRAEQEENRESKRKAGQESAKRRWGNRLGLVTDPQRTHDSVSNRTVTDCNSASASTSASTTTYNINTPPERKRAPRTPKNPIEGKAEYAPFVWLTESQHSALVEKFGRLFVDRCCEKLSGWIGSKPIPGRIQNGRNAAHTFRSWVLNAVAQEQTKAEREQRNLTNGAPLTRHDRNMQELKQYLEEE